MANVMKAAIILHNMIMEARRDGYKSELHEFALAAASKGSFLDERGEEKEYKWHTHDHIISGSHNGEEADAWQRHIENVDKKLKDEVAHLALKLDLINSIWERHGNH